VDPLQLQQLLTVAAGILIGVGVGGAGLVAVKNATATSRRRARLSSDGGVVSKPVGAGGAAFAGVLDGVRRLGDRGAISDPSKVSALRQKLMQAGFYSREAVTLYLGVRSVALVAATVGALAVTPWILSGGGGMVALLMALVFAGAAVLGPDQFIKSRRTKLEREYREGFPDLLDLMVASVEAGLSLDAAVNRITGELARRYPNLTEHLRLLTLELRAGRARKEVWARLADRLGIDEARSFATMLRQAEDMGTSVGETLTAFSDDMRQKRMLRAEEKALALPAKLVVPLILFIFPCLLGVLIMPAVFQVMQASGGH
jgi:tight adherence protein C